MLSDYAIHYHDTNDLFVLECQGKPGAGIPYCHASGLFDLCCLFSIVTMGFPLKRVGLWKANFLSLGGGKIPLRRGGQGQ